MLHPSHHTKKVQKRPPARPPTSLRACPPALQPVPGQLRALRPNVQTTLHLGPLVHSRPLRPLWQKSWLLHGGRPIGPGPRDRRFRSAPPPMPPPRPAPPPPPPAVALSTTKTCLASLLQLLHLHGSCWRQRFMSLKVGKDARSHVWVPCPSPREPPSSLPAVLTSKAPSPSRFGCSA